MIEDYLHEASSKRSVENPGGSSSDGGDSRFIVYGRRGADKSKKKSKKGQLVGDPVNLDLTGDSLADEIVQVHNEETVKQKVEELGDRAHDQTDDKS